MTVSSVVLVASRGHPVARTVAPGQVVVDLSTRRISTEHGTARFTPTKFRILAFILVRLPAASSRCEIADFLYGDDADGGPLYAENLCSVNLVQSRAARHGIGLHVTRQCHAGYRIEIAGPVAVAA